MKLVELLARELEQWPAGLLGNDGMTQDRTGEVNTLDSGCTPNFYEKDGVWLASSHSFLEGYEPMKRASDYKTAIVTREMWQAERDRQKGGEWKRHRGGKMPVEKGARVEVKHRNGEVYEDEAGSGYSRDWSRTGDAGDIMQYRVISQPQAEEVDVKDTTIGTLSLKVEVDTSDATQAIDDLAAKWDQIETPFKWRDEVTELNAYIEKYTRERDALIERLASEGFALIPPVVSVVSEFSGVDMSDWNNWQVGDVIKVISNTGGHEFAIGTEVTVITVDTFDRSYRIEATAGGNDWWLAKDDGEFIRRP